MFRSSFWNSEIHFRNAETLVEIAYDYTSCNDVKVENFNGKLYLACDNHTYSFEANNGYFYFTQLSGNKHDLRGNYTYNGYIHTSDGTTSNFRQMKKFLHFVETTAACNSTCDGYVLDNCTAGNGGDGW